MRIRFSMLQPVSNKTDFPGLERDMLAFWERHRTFQRGKDLFELSFVADLILPIDRRSVSPHWDAANDGRIRGLLPGGRSRDNPRRETIAG